ncbi:hypothetical protein, partial [Streptomyces sp. NPDC002790]|uniref:hypothetical protein n=1 Tax=Streptomyces sp. NPDC002790 TaxID=3154431 RepID=UPI003333E7BA
VARRGGGGGQAQTAEASRSCGPTSAVQARRWGMVLVPVGEVVAHVREVGPQDAEPVLGQVLQALRGVRICRLVEVLIEGGTGREDLAEGDEDAVVGGGEFGQDVGDLVGGAGFADLLGEVGGLGANGEVVRLAHPGVEGFVGLHVVFDGTQPGDGAGGETFLFGFVEADGQAVIGLVQADDGDEPGALKDAVGFGIAAAGEDFPGVHIAPQGQVTIGEGQEGDAF